TRPWPQRGARRASEKGRNGSRIDRRRRNQKPAAREYGRSGRARRVRRADILRGRRDVLGQRPPGVRGRSAALRPRKQTQPQRHVFLALLHSAGVRTKSQTLFSAIEFKGSPTDGIPRKEPRNDTSVRGCFMRQDAMAVAF